MLHKEQQLEQLKKAINNDSELLSPEDEQAIILQVESEYLLSFKHTESKRNEQLKRLKLYNNQGRGKGKVGDPLLFVMFQTILAAVYDSKLTSKWQVREEGDVDVEENLNALAEYDYDLMGKDVIDYEWTWDTLFFGRGLVMLNEFSRDKSIMAPVPEVINPMHFIRDPIASSVNGNRQGFGACRFFGREILLTNEQMKNNKAFYALDEIHPGDKDPNSMIDASKQMRDIAQGRQNENTDMSIKENFQNELLEWFTTYKGKRYIITLGNKRKTLNRFQELKGNRWPVIERSIFPIAHDWDGVNIPDLIEDKQRMRAILMNLAVESAKSDVHPMYLFDKKKISNPNDLNFNFNKFIPTKDLDGNTLQPFPKSKFGTDVNLILNLLDVSAQKAVAAPEIAQGVNPRVDRTLGEHKLVQAGSDTRHSLALRIFGWSDKNFWRQWYYLYKTNFKDDIDKKVIRLQGQLAPEWRTLTRENIITEIDPDVRIESSFIVEQNRVKEFNNFTAFIQVAFADPETNRRYALRKFAKINQMSKAERDLMFPPNIDEIRAEHENKLLDENEFVEVNPLDNHAIHREIHSKANQNKASVSHIQAHNFMELLMRENPEAFPQTEKPLENTNIVDAPKESVGLNKPAPTSGNVTDVTQ